MIHTIEAIPGYWVASEDKHEAEVMAESVRSNIPFVLARVRHGDGPERPIIAINRKRGTVVLAVDDARGGVATEGDEVPWAECRWTP